MNKFINLALVTVGTLWCFNASAASIHNNDDPTTFLGPTLKAAYTAPLSNNTAFSALGEVGLKNLRVGATLGWRWDAAQRLKFSAEWLRQDITYAFFSGNSNEWVHQWAIGAAYQYDFLGFNCNPAFDLSAYYSHAPSRRIGTRSGRYTDYKGTIYYYTNLRRIAGSDAAGIAPGVSFVPWFGSKAGLELNYDHVEYDNKYRSDRDANGFGGTIRFGQRLTDCLLLDLSAAFRRPFNNYRAALGWVSPYYNGALSIAIDAAYTVGRESLPDTWNLGLSFNYLLEPCQLPAPISLKGEVLPPVRDPFWAWSATPAVYMPQVLAIVDERVDTDPAPISCPDALPPVVVGTLPEQYFLGTINVDAAPAFSGNNLVFSIESNAISPNSTTIDPHTGLMTLTFSSQGQQDTYQVTVTASNACGSVSTTFISNREQD